MTRKTPKKVTPEAVAEVKEIKAKYPDMSDEMIGRLCDFSHATVNKILAGKYDQKPERAPKAEKADADDLALAVLELSSTVEKQNEVLKKMALALAVIIDPRSGKTSVPVADAIRSAVRGKDD